MGNSANVATPEVEAASLGQAKEGETTADGQQTLTRATASDARPAAPCVDECSRTSHELIASCFRLDGGGEERNVQGAVELQLPRYSDLGMGPQVTGGSLPGVSEVDKTRYYREVDSIRGALAGGDTTLLRGSWLQQLHAGGGTLPRWQDIPKEGVWDAEELLRDVADPQRPTPRIVAISYSWLSREHPDPNGFHFDIFVPMLKHYVRHHQIGLESLALFIDWCSLPQRPWSDAEQKAHRRALRNIDLWYAHTLTDVWILSSVPEGAVPFEDRGWTRFEVAAATMICPSESTIDLGSMTAGSRNWSQVVEECRYQRKPPQLPDAFAHQLESKSFAYPEDRRLVADKYWGVFHRATGCADVLPYAGLGWRDAEVRILASALPSCAGLRELDLRDNELGAIGALVLARAVEECKSLQSLQLTNNAIGEAAQKELRDAWARAQRPEAGLEISGQRPSATSDESDRAASQAIERAERAAAAAAATGGSGGGPGGGTFGFKGGGSAQKKAGGKLPEESNQTLNSLLARQSAFEARIEAAMAKVAESVVELGKEVGADLQMASHPSKPCPGGRRVGPRPVGSSPQVSAGPVEQASRNNGAFGSTSQVLPSQSL